jgi:hypothetical protein
VVRNVHERIVPAPIERVGPLLDRIGGPHDVLWPSPGWQPMVLDGPLAVGTAGGHGGIRYRVTGYVPGRRIEFAFAPETGLLGRHTFTADPAGPDRTLLRHVADCRLAGLARLTWPLAIRWVHDAVLEELFDNGERAVGAEPARPARRSAYVRLLRVFEVPRSTATAPPRTPLIAGALPHVDWTDAYAVHTLPGMPADPQVWADAVFRDPPRWVLAALRLRELLVGLVGIDRSGAGAFDTLAGTEDEVLLGADSNHLDFRASVRCEQHRIVLTTVVQLHNRRGRAYSALVRPVHPIVVRAMLNRAARRLSGSSKTPVEPAPTMAP